MNIFELSRVVCPIVGTVAGIHSTSGAPTLRVLAAALSGLVLGLGCYCAAMLLFVVILKLARWDPNKERLSGLQRCAEFVAVFLPVAALIAAWFSASYITRIIFG